MRDLQYPCGETGVLGILRGEKAPGGAVALRADMDALPIQETHETDYSSTVPGIMHACGHDAHIACLLGAARLLSAHRAELAGEVRLIFQPAEEIGQGARAFIDAGALKGVETWVALPWISARKWSTAALFKPGFTPTVPAGRS